MLVCSQEVKQAGSWCTVAATAAAVRLSLHFESITMLYPTQKFQFLKFPVYLQAPTQIV